MQIWLQKCMPQHAISALAGKLANWRAGKLKNWAIYCFIKFFNVNMQEALQTDYTQFNTFNEFFTRKLKPEARPIDNDLDTIISPVDGVISELGTVDDEAIFQAKNHFYQLTALLASHNYSHFFRHGSFLTAYLAPKDYHRFHMPISGKLLEMTYVPGDLFSVSTHTAQHLPGLFARNERVICIFETAIGKMAFIAVGAMIVGNILMNWHGIVRPKERHQIFHWKYEMQHHYFDKGAELGCFQLGSTIIMLFEPNTLVWSTELHAGQTLKMGQLVAHKNSPT